MCAYILAFYCPFSLLRHSTFFSLNRVFLVAGLLLSFALALYTGPVPTQGYEPTDLLMMEPLIDQTPSVVSKATEPAGTSLAMIVAAVYVLGALVRLILVVSSAAGIARLERDGKPRTRAGHPL